MTGTAIIQLTFPFSNQVTSVYAHFPSSPMEFIFPHRMGYRPMPVSALEKQQAWQGLMLEFPVPFSGTTLIDIAKDSRANQLQAIRISSRSTNLLSQLADRFINLDVVFLDDEGLDFLNKSNDPSALLHAYPGLSKLYMKKGFENPDIPLRHIGLNYIGMPYSPAKKRLGNLILPNLAMLALNMEGINFFDSPVLASELIEELKLVVSKQLFPAIDRLYISHCEFINRLASEVLMECPGLSHLDLMNCSEIDTQGNRVSTDLKLLLRIATNQSIHLTTDETVKATPDSIKSNTELLPY